MQQIAEITCPETIEFLTYMAGEMQKCVLTIATKYLACEPVSTAPYDMGW